MIILDFNSRKKFTNPDKNIDITIIEIKPEKDEINDYLEIDENDIYQNKENIELEYINKSINLLHYPKEKLNVYFWIINNIIDNKKINYKCTTEDGSSGCPILSLETFKVIGIHYGLSKISKFNYGTFIKYAIDLFNNNNYNKNNNNYYSNNKDNNKNDNNNYINNYNNCLN